MSLAYRVFGTLALSVVSLRLLSRLYVWLLANKPFALAAGMGLNSFFLFRLFYHVLLEVIQFLMAMVLAYVILISGIIFLILSITE